MSNEEFDNLKEELMWEGSSVVMLSNIIIIYILASFIRILGKWSRAPKLFGGDKVNPRIDFGVDHPKILKLA